MASPSEWASSWVSASLVTRESSTETGWSVAVPCGCELGERPVWDADASAVWWVDVHAGHLHRLEIGGSDTIFAIEPPLGAVGLARGGGVVVAAGGVVTVLDQSGQQVDPTIPIGIPEGGRFNDGAVDPAGRFLIGTTESASGRADGMLLRVRSTGEVELLLDDVVESNGLAWSLDNATMYYVDSGEPAVRRYRYGGRRTLTRLRDLVVFDEGDGAPDGLVADGAGDVWVAMWDGAAVRRHTSTGELRELLRTPVSRPTCPAITATGSLYLTTGWEGMSDTARAAEPWAGHLLRRTVNATPAPAARFGC